MLLMLMANLAAGGAAHGSYSRLRGWKMAACLNRGNHLNCDGRPRTERLVDHAIAFGELEKAGALLAADLALEIETEPDCLEADRRLTVDPQRAAKIEIAFRPDLGTLKRNPERD